MNIIFRPPESPRLPIASAEFYIFIRFSAVVVHYLLAFQQLHQNMPSVIGKPWNIMSPNAKAIFLGHL